MSAKFAFVSTLGLVMLLNGFSVGAATNSKDTKKKDEKSAITMSLASNQRSEEKKKDDEEKQDLVAVNSYQPALMKPASWRHFQQQQHRHHRYTTNA